jgi:tRNA pseudouridine38-40 synthase
MRYFKLTIAYDGTDFHGWQTQSNKPTIQGEIAVVLRQ